MVGLLLHSEGRESICGGQLIYSDDSWNFLSNCGCDLSKATTLARKTKDVYVSGIRAWVTPPKNPRPIEVVTESEAQL